MSHLEAYVVYKNPADYPDKYVVRKWVGLTADPEPLIVCDTLAQARQVVPEYLYRLDHHPEEDACIFETWI